MNVKELIDLAGWSGIEEIERFAEIVDAAAVAREREACAKECESIGQHNFITLCAAAIRKRTE